MGNIIYHQVLVDEEEGGGLLLVSTIDATIGEKIMVMGLFIPILLVIPAGFKKSIFCVRADNIDVGVLRGVDVKRGEAL